MSFIVRRDVPEPARLLTAVARHQRLLRRRASVHRHPQDLLHGVRRLLLVSTTKPLKLATYGKFVQFLSVISYARPDQ